MRRLSNIFTLLAALLACASCTFKNDMSYPQLQGRITAFSVEGQKSVTINDEAQTVEGGERIAQMAIVPFLKAEYEVSDELSDTARGAGGFGSTGRK